MQFVKKNKVVFLPFGDKKITNISSKDVLFGALDLGTNSCRMLIAKPKENNFEVIDAFSRLVFLGGDLKRTGRLSEHGMERTLDALKICASKLRKHQVQHLRLVATESCRQACNGKDFIKRIYQVTNLKLEIIKPEEEVRLAVIGCASHLRKNTDQVLIIDIGGGSTELIWLDLADIAPCFRQAALLSLRRNFHKNETVSALYGIKVVDWVSVPFGVTTLWDHFSDIDDDMDRYAMMSWYFEEYISEFGPVWDDCQSDKLSNFQIIGTSGTITTIASTHLGLKKYNRDLVDGLDMTEKQVNLEIDRYLEMGSIGRNNEPCIGKPRSHLIMSGAAIFQSILRIWPTDTITVADRGLREGLLYSQMAKAGYLK